jgi:exodeoxyribonuclease VII small subunit
VPRTPAQKPPRTELMQDNFEASIERLGKIVEELESGSLPLEESLRLFEEGVRLTRSSQSILDGAEKRVEELLGIDEEGNPIVRELAEEA